MSFVPDESGLDIEKEPMPVKDGSSQFHRLCVCASGSFIIDIFIFRTAMSVSCLHFGQYNGKFSRTVSSRIFNRVLLPQTGHKIHSVTMLSTSVFGLSFFLPYCKLTIFICLLFLPILGFFLQLALLMLEL